MDEKQLDATVSHLIHRLEAAPYRWRSANHPMLSHSAASVGMTRHDCPLIGFRMQAA